MGSTIICKSGSAGGEILPPTYWWNPQEDFRKRPRFALVALPFGSGYAGLGEGSGERSGVNRMVLHWQPAAQNKGRSQCLLQNVQSEVTGKNIDVSSRRAEVNFEV